ncbi:hypothetical protein RB653_009883 [Dictyostelium firmibasis]|uniref:EGF-like domain-containing protein n=1 Tax=Dictyostelium firmibasis TaxID=79012 RepID=A0AAN7TSB7_9MYCE
MFNNDNNSSDSNIIKKNENEIESYVSKKSKSEKFYPVRKWIIQKLEFCKGGEEQIDNFKELYNNQRFTVEYDDFTDWILSYLKSTHQYELKKGEKLPFQLKKQCDIPSSVESLTFCNDFNQVLSEGLIPSSVKSLTFGDYFNQVLSAGSIPSSVKSLTFGDDFNQVLSAGSIPSSVKSLKFGLKFNQVLSAGSIPSSVETLTIGNYFNQVLSEGSIPSSVKSLTFGYCFNKVLSAGSIPSSVKSLTFGDYFNQVLSAGSIPSSVKSLTFGHCFNQVLSARSIPSSVKSLTFGDYFNQVLSAGSIPSSVKSLTFGDGFNQVLSEGSIPSSVKSLTFGDCYNQVLSAGSIPSSVESLTFGNDFNQVLSAGSIPSSVKSLTFDYRFNQVLLAGSIPSSVKSLTFGYCFDRVLSEGLIPSSVESLTFGYDYNQVLSAGSIPSSVKSLTFGFDYNQVLSAGSIPSSVKSIEVVEKCINLCEENKYLLIFILKWFWKSKELSPPPNELSALYNLINKFNITMFNSSKYQFPDIFCEVLECSPITGSIIGGFQLYPDLVSPINAVLTSTDLKNFTNVPLMVLSNFQIDNELIYYKFESVESISFVYVRGLKEINNTLPAYSSMLIDCADLENTSFKLSFINNATSYFSIVNANLNLIDDFPVLPTLFTLVLSINNLPNISMVNTNIINLKFSSHFNISSLELNFQTIKSRQTVLQDSNDSLLFYPCEILYDQYFILDLKANSHFGFKLLPPVNNSIIDLSSKNYGFISFDNVGNKFNVERNSKFIFPVLVGPYVVIVFKNGNISQTNPLSQFGRGESISVINSRISGDLDLYQPNDGYVRRLYDFTNNFITGTIDESWCSAQLVITNNRMNGTIPSCYSCYFKYPLRVPENILVTKIYDGFIGNNFTNLDLSIECTTFAPQIQKSSVNSFYVYGKDIGFYGDKFLVNDSIICTTYKVIEFGQKYECGIHPSYSFDGVNYFKINFIFPHDRDYYFPLIKRSPIISFVSYSNNVLLINGSYFSSYLGHVPQSINLLNSSFDISNSSDFFSIQAIPTFKAVPKGLFDILTINTNSMITKVLINSTSSSVNNKTCKNDCIDSDHGMCNLYLGKCVCDINFEGDDCSILQFYITSVQPSPTIGGEAVFFGLFGDNFNNLSLLIGELDCQITFNSTNLIKCIAPPGNGIKTVILKQNNKIFKGNNIYKYIEIVLPCPNKCSNNGICNTTTGICNCNNGYSLYDCSAQINTDTGDSSGTNTTIDPNTGSTNITNSQTQFQVYIKSLIEVDLNNNIIKSYSLLSDWTFKTENEIETNKYILKQQLKNNNSSLNSKGCIVTSIIEEIKDKNGKEFTFAGTSFIVSSGSIKFTISIANYTYQNNLNTLKLELISSVVDNIDKINNDCNSKDTEIDTSNVNDLSTFNYIKISKNNKIFSGRFINKVISDGRSTFFTTNSRNNSNSIIVTLNLPHCVNECLIDPDFSVLISNDFKSECDDDDSSRKWLIPVAVIVPVVGVAIIITIFFAIYKKSMTLKIMFHATKLKNLNK